MSVGIDKGKSFAGERFVFADSQSLGPAPWDTRPQPPKRTALKNGRRVTRRAKRSINAPTKRRFKRKFQLLLLLLLAGLTFLASKTVLPCYVTIAVCYASQAICEIDRLFFSASTNPLCKLALLSHTPNELHLVSQTCPTTVLWTVKPYVFRTLIRWRQNPITFSRNYAAYGGGARVLRRYTSRTHGLPPPSIFGSLAESVFGYNPQYANVNGAVIILEESVSVGECWRISGGFGHVAVNLSEPVVISHIAVDHASPSLLSEDDVLSAPKDMTLWALLPSTDNANAEAEYESGTPARSLGDFKSTKDGKDSLPLSSRLLQITHFQYDILKRPTRQVFPVRRHFPTQTIVLQINTNQGSDTTCLYWLGIYGVN